MSRPSFVVVSYLHDLFACSQLFPLALFHSRQGGWLQSSREVRVHIVTARETSGHSLARFVAGLEIMSETSSEKSLSGRRMKRNILTRIVQDVR